MFRKKANPCISIPVVRQVIVQHFYLKASIHRHTFHICNKLDNFTIKLVQIHKILLLLCMYKGLYLPKNVVFGIISTYECKRLKSPRKMLNCLKLLTYRFAAFLPFNYYEFTGVNIHLRLLL